MGYDVWTVLFLLLEAWGLGVREPEELLAFRPVCCS